MLDFVGSSRQSEEDSIKKMTYYFVEDVREQFNDDSVRADIWYYIVEDIWGYPKEDSVEEKKTSIYYVSRRIVVLQ